MLVEMVIRVVERLICIPLSMPESECPTTALIERTSENNQDSQNPPNVFQNHVFAKY